VGGAMRAGFAALFAAVTGTALVGFAAWRLPPVASVHGHGVDATIEYLLVATGAVFVVGHAVLMAFVCRARPAGEAYRAPSRTAEVWWALGPVAVMVGIAEAGVLFVGASAWAAMYTDAPADALVVEVVGKQFEWLVRYPGKDGKFGAVDPAKVHETRNPLGLDKKDPAAKDDLVSRGTLVLPVGRPVLVRLRSLDTLHSFWVPAARVKQDLVPGSWTQAQFTLEGAGEHEIACAEVCGLGHYKMRGLLRALPDAEYARWLAAQTGWFE